MIGAASSVLLSLAGLVASAGPASAGHVGCGDFIFASTVLDSDIGPCGVGLTIVADNITLDLNGHTISGREGPGDGPGVLIDGRTGVVVKNGTVTQFDAGVAIEGGSGNTVENMRIVDNRGDFSTDYGDGIAVFVSTENVIRNNIVQNNGPYDGIGLIGADRNTVEGNQVLFNNMDVGTSGIRLENIGLNSADGNLVLNNVVQSSGNHGIQLFARAKDNIIRGNQSFRNRVDGITVAAGGTRNLIENNSSRFNGRDGIRISAAAGTVPAATNNTIRRNSATGNVVFDLRDLNVNCDANIWTGNIASSPAKVSPPCTLNP
ncbi:MAG: nitrous oxide reductase family maturation protein NosD [Acidimicrobiales bacterium]